MQPAARSKKRKTRAKTKKWRDTVADRLLTIVHGLALEIRAKRTGELPINLDSDLERDLGFDSLGLAELLLRLDKAFKVKLPEHLIAEATTPRDLLQAILEASPKSARARVATGKIAVSLPETTAPADAETLIDVLSWHARAHGERPHLKLWGGRDEGKTISYGELENTARIVAFGLRANGLEPGERVAIMLPTHEDYFFAFYGVLYAGGIPVPIYPPFRRAQVVDHLRRQAGILRNAGASYLITSEEIRKVGVLLFGLVDDLRSILTVAQLSASKDLADAAPVRSDDTALIQYTSGSTGDPKGVVLSHHNLLTNIRVMGETMGADSTDIFVSWLPLYHDMGLIGAWLGSLYFGAQLIIMSPLAFLADPARWLWTIHRHRATLSAAPNFAFELCLKNVKDDDIEGLDLGSLRMLLNGAEPVSPSTISRFTEKFAPFGFRPEAFAPVYGLAESSVGLTFPPPSRLPIIDHVNREALSAEGVARSARKADESELQFVACGRPLVGHEVRIVDDSGHELPDRHEGRLQFKGSSTTAGYFRNPAKTRALFDGNWLESGDLAYIAKGDVFITGRVKDVIIKGGRNIYPHELEEAVGDIDGVRKGCVAAFPSMDERTGSERLIVLAETRLTDSKSFERLRGEISSASSSLLGMPPDDIIIAPPHTVPKTSSGKLRRSAAREIYEKGEIGRTESALWWQLVRLSFAGTPNLARRAMKTGIEYLFALYWWTLTCIVGAIVWLLVSLLPGRKLRFSAVNALARLFFRLTTRSYVVIGEAPAPERGGVFVANHSSYLDGAAVLAAIPGELGFVAKEELKGQLIAGRFLKRLGTIFVRRTDPKGGLEDTDQMLNAADAGARVMTFPEGTFTRMPGLLPFHLGAFHVAVKSGRPIIPVTIKGTRSILRGSQWFPRFGSVSIHIGEEIKPKGRDFDAALKMRDAARAEILARSDEPDLAAERVRL